MKSISIGLANPLQFLNPAEGKPARLGILPGSFNPPTRAHCALAEAALTEVDQVVLVLPRTFPHKIYEGADFAQRADMLRVTVDRQSRLMAATSQGGLFLEIAAECRAVYGAAVELAFICGRDAAERVVNWPYDDPGTLGRMFDNFHLLVASRDGAYDPPAHVRHRIRPLPLASDLDSVSASEVRRRIRQGAPWEHLVPEAIVPIVRKIYRPPA